MESDALKNALVTFAVDVLIEAQARLGAVIEDWRFQIFLPWNSGNYCPIRKGRFPPPPRARPPLKGILERCLVSLGDGRGLTREMASPEGRAA